MSSSSQSTSHDGAISVLLAGTLTSALALALVFLLDKWDVNVMGFYANGILPVGAMLVGIVASSGFGFGSWRSGTKITGVLLGLVIATLLASYFVGQYLEYRQLMAGELRGSSLGFWRYFDLLTRSFRWQSQHSSDGPSEPLGLLGYGLRILEIAGFVVGGAGAPLLLRSSGYCETCRSYYRRHALGWLAAGSPLRRGPKPDDRELESRALGVVDAVFCAAEAGDVEAMQAQLTAHALPHAKVTKLRTRISLELRHCRGCFSGHLRATAQRGSGPDIRTSILKDTAMAPGAIAGIVGRPVIPDARVRPRG